MLEATKKNSIFKQHHHKNGEDHLAIMSFNNSSHLRNEIDEDKETSIFYAYSVRIYKKIKSNFVEAAEEE